jgi:hypothetical protein
MPFLPSPHSLIRHWRRALPATPPGGRALALNSLLKPIRRIPPVPGWILLPAILASGLLSLLPDHGEAQLKVVPQVGLYAPVADLGEIRDNAGQTLVELGRRESTLALGVELEWGRSESSLGVRGGVAHATRSEIPIQGVGCADCSARSSLTAVGAALVVRPFPQMALVRPLLLAGGGVLYHDFDDRQLREENWTDVLVNQSQPYLHLGMGTHLFLGPLTPQIEFSARVSGFDPGGGPPSVNPPQFMTSGDRQTNLFLTVGIPLGR